MVLPDLFTPGTGLLTAAMLLMAAVALVCAGVWTALPRLYRAILAVTPAPANDNEEGFVSPRSRIFEV